MSVGLLIAVFVGVLVLIVKRFAGEPVDARDTFLTPLILVGIGGYSVVHVDGLDGTDIGWLVLGAVIGIAFGAVRGTTTVLFERDGYLWQRYTVKTLAVWGVSTVAGFGVSALGSVMGMHPEARPITLSIGVGMLGEMLTLGLRALATGVPFAPAKPTDGWSDSAGAQGNSPALDRFLRNLGHPGSAQPRESRSHQQQWSERIPQYRHPSEPGNHQSGPDDIRQDRPRRSDDTRPDRFPPYPEQENHQSRPDAVRQDRPTGPAPRLDHSPTFRDGVDWLRTRRR
ncbi:hypothetical protein [Nocardia brasiliensis]|uniref:DUF1453 domain-containing protein n=1 Tax=Nocardia brasiliensis (strain ATCC 700358 / HUJEG-1) TaxID=1133849 RepID=K0F8X8_NOCB7|nr:hypothetical protein [Nocardia brasiliensis]AFU06209.1 hypothetical protein O3I_041320 [Nocardia brasiliensis ATCC 700358]